MTFPQLNAGTRLISLTNKIISASTPEESKKLFFSVKGGLLRSRLKKKIIQSPREDDSMLSFLIPKPKSPVFLPPSKPEKTLQARQSKWLQISDNLLKMDSVILKEYREKRKEFKTKSKRNNYPF